MSDSLRQAAKELVDELAKSWSRALTARATRAKSGDLQQSSMSLTLSNIGDLNNLFHSVKVAAREALQMLQGRLQLLSEYVLGLKPENETALSFSPTHETIINQLGEIAKLSGSGCITEVQDRSSTYPGTIITTYGGSLFIVAPAGFGKTSFCRWNAGQRICVLGKRTRERSRNAKSPTRPLPVLKRNEMCSA